MTTTTQTPGARNISTAKAFIAAHEAAEHGGSVEYSHGGGSRGAWADVRDIASGAKFFATHPITARVGTDVFHIG